MRKDVDLLRMEKSVYASNEWPCIFTTPWALKNHNTIFFPAIGQTTTWQMGTNESFLGCWGIQMQPVSNSHPFHQTGHKGILISTKAECRCQLMPQQAKKNCPIHSSNLTSLKQILSFQPRGHTLYSLFTCTVQNHLLLFKTCLTLNHL